ISCRLRRAFRRATETCWSRDLFYRFLKEFRERFWFRIQPVETQTGVSRFETSMKEADEVVRLKRSDRRIVYCESTLVCSQPSPRRGNGQDHRNVARRESIEEYLRGQA